MTRTARAAAISILISIGTLATVFSMFVGVQSCSWFDKHVEPVVKPIASCAGQSVSAADFQEAVNDLEQKNYSDLAEMGIRLGWDVLACIVDNIGAQKPALKTNGDEFKAQHARQIREAQKPSVSLRSPGEAHPKVGPMPVAEHFSYSGESISAAMNRCVVACAPSSSIGSPGDDCLCWRADQDARKSRWVTLRRSPPGGGPGLAVGGGG
jgi:hypothetical protein